MIASNARGESVFKTRKVTIAIKRVERSAAWTDHWPRNPFTVQYGPGFRDPVTAKIPDRLLFVELIHSFCRMRFSLHN